MTLWLILLVTLLPPALVLLVIMDGTPASASVVGDEVRIMLRGPYKVLALRSRVTVRLDQVETVEVVDHARSLGRGRRLGTYIPGGPIAGTFTKGASKSFWAVRHDRAVVISTVDHRFDRLVIEVAEPERLAQQINAAARE